MAKKSSHDLGRIIISIIYIVLGAGSLIAIVNAVKNFDVWAILACVGGAVMFFAGLLGLFNAKPGICRILGLIVFVLAAISFVKAIIAGAFTSFMTWVYLVQAIIAWYFVIWIKGNK